MTTTFGNCFRTLAGLRPHYRLRTLFLVTFVAASLFSWIAWQRELMHGEVRAITSLRTDNQVFLCGPDRSDGRELATVPYLDGAELWHGRIFRPITHVFLTGSNIDTHVWDDLRSFRYLESLTLQDCRLDPAAQIDFSVFRQLHYFSAIRTPLTVNMVQRMTHLSLKSLVLSDAGVTPDWMPHIAQLRGLQNLTLSHADISDDAIESIGNLRDIESLSMESTNVRITEKSAHALRQFRNLRVLYLSNTDVSDEGLHELVAVTGIESLFLDGTKITDAGAVWFSGFTNLKELYLANTRLTDRALAPICQITGLRVLDLHGTRVTHVSLQKLARMQFLDRSRVDTGNTAITNIEYERWRVGAGRGPEKGGPKKVGPEKVGPEKVGPEKVQSGTDFNS